MAHSYSQVECSPRVHYYQVPSLGFLPGSFRPDPLGGSADLNTSHHDNMKHVPKGLLALITPLLCAPSLAQDFTKNAHSTLRAPLTNLYGAPLEKRNGEPIEYDRTRLAMQKAAWQARGGSIPTPPPGGCESTGALAKWKWFDIGTGIGQSGFAVSESTFGTELIVTGGGSGFGGNRYWQIYQHDPISGNYFQKFTSPIYESGSFGGGGLRQLVAGDFDNDTFNEILIIHNSVVEVWDQNTRQIENSFQVLSDANCARLRDMDQDGTLELLVSNASSTQVYNSQGQSIWSYPQGTTDVAIGQMDADPGLEIALNSGHVIDYATQVSQWYWMDGFPGYLESGDIDGDGLDELIATKSWDLAWAFDVDTQLPKWSLSIFNTGATDLVDLDNDGQLELIIGEAQWGGMLIYDANTRVLEATINNPEHGTTEVIVADADNDGMMEVIWGAGHSSSGEDIMFVGDWSTQAHEWKSFDLDGPFRTPVMGDVTGDGIDEFVTICNESESGYGAGRILVFDSQTLQLLAISEEVSEGLGWSGTHEVELAQMDSDPALEMVVASSRTYSSRIEVYDFDGVSTFTKIWTSPAVPGSSDGAVLDVAVADVDGDGTLEIIGVVSSGYAYVFSAEFEVLEWITPFQITSGAKELEVGNADSDPALEIFVLGENGSIYIFDGVTQAIQEIVTGFDAATISLSDPGLGAEILMIGTQTGDLVTAEHNGSNYVQTTSVNLASEPLEQLIIRSAQVVFAGVDDALRMYNAISGTEIWGSCREYGGSFGQGVGFGPNYIVSSGLYGLVLFGRHN